MLDRGRPREWAAITAIVVAGAACGASDSRDESGTDAIPPRSPIVLRQTYSASYPESIRSKPEDFVDPSGRLWHWKGPAKFHPPGYRPPGPTGGTGSPTIHPTSTSASGSDGSKPESQRDKLATSLRAVRLIGDQQYELAEPDYALADRILAMPTPPDNPPSLKPQDAAPSPPELGKLTSHLTPQTRFGPNAFPNLFRISSSVWPNWASNATWYAPFADMSGCTATNIGPSTALTAAHCICSHGAWIWSEYAFGNDVDAYWHQTYPYGHFYPDNVTIPWSSWIGCMNGTRDEDNDFAVVEFSPTRYPGAWWTGWYGVTGGYPASGESYYLLGYPGDQIPHTMWESITSGYYELPYNPQFLTWLSIYDGNSGGCVSRLDHYCFGILISETSGFNAARKWNSTTYSFFDTYGNWP